MAKIPDNNPFEKGSGPEPPNRRLIPVVFILPTVGRPGQIICKSNAALSSFTYYVWEGGTGWEEIGLSAGAHNEDHDHDGTPTQKLLASNTHETDPATDTHHTKYTNAEAKAAASVATDVIWDTAGDLAVADGPDSAVKLPVGSAPASNTTPAALQAQWGGETGDARKVLTVSASGVVSWESLFAYDIFTPAQMLTFSDGLSSTLEIASGGTVTPVWACTYSPTDGADSLNIDVSSTGISPDVGGSDYPLAAGAGAGDPYTAPTGEIAINKETTTVGAVTTWTADAVVNGVDVANLTTTITWLNVRMWGVSTVSDIDTEAKIDTFMAIPNSDELAATTATIKAMTVNGTTEYLYFLYRSALADPTFFDDDTGLGFDMTQTGVTVSWTNDSGFVENYDVWRSTNILAAGTYNLRVDA